MKQFQGAIFDLDGTLLDSNGVWEQIDKDFLGRRGIPVPEDYVKAIAPLGFHAAAEYTARRFGLPETPEQLMDEWNQMARDAYHNRIALKPGAREYLEFLRKNQVRLAVATSSYEDLFLPALERHGIRDWFDAVVTVSQVSRGKGFPDIYWRAAELLEIPPTQCMVFEDIWEGLKGAKDGGFTAVAVYDLYCREEEEKMRQTADHYIRSFWELL